MNDSQQAFYDRYIDEKVQGAPSLHRGRRVIELVDATGSVLDVGCGTGELLEAVVRAKPGLAGGVGMDLAATVTSRLAARGLRGVVGDLNQAWPFPSEAFDNVIAAEVIEHVFDTDSFVREAWRVLKPGGAFIVTTPNLAYAANRLLLTLGIQPLFTETSTSRSLGRWLGALGQGNPTQGHLKIFTGGALRELLEMSNFKVETVRGYRFIQSGVLGAVDHMLTLRPTLSAGFAVRARKAGSGVPA